MTKGLEKKKIKLKEKLDIIKNMLVSCKNSKGFGKRPAWWIKRGKEKGFKLQKKCKLGSRNVLLTLKSVKQQQYDYLKRTWNHHHVWFGFKKQERLENC